jgi:serine/threonine-protein kinase
LAKVLTNELVADSRPISYELTGPSPAHTASGVILGTVGYMAPEQIRGQAVDARTDIFAFGCVLYEMLAGRRAFSGETPFDTLSAILKDTPAPLASHAPDGTIAPQLVRIVERCLEKAPAARFQTAVDLAFALRSSLPPDTTMASGGPSAAFVPFWRHALPWATAAVLGIALVSALTVWSPWRSAPVLTPRKLLANIGADASLPSASGLAMSPDGTMFAFVGRQAGQRQRLYVRRLDQLQAVLLAGTENAVSPFFSSDGKWLAFFAGGKLKKVAVTGGATSILCDAPGGRGGTWLEDDTIVFGNSTNATLMRVSAAGGSAAEFGLPGESAATRHWPQALPGGKGVLYTEHLPNSGFDDANIVITPLAGGTPTIVVRGGYFGRYVPGHLIYMKQGTLLAVRLDLERLEAIGPAVPALEDVSASLLSGLARLAVSGEGTLVYQPGEAGVGTNPIDWITRDGQTSVLRAAKADWSNPRFSPDGKRLALDISDGKQRDIWVYDWARDTLTQMTFDPGEDRAPVWTRDSRRIVFASDRAKAGVSNLYWVNANDPGDVARLTDSPHSAQAFSWHPSGRFLAFQENRGDTTGGDLMGYDLMILPMAGDAARGWTPGTPTVFLATPVAELSPMFSPDGRWIAYMLGSGVYVRPFSGSGGPWRVSTTGGIGPRWSTTTHELLYQDTTFRVLSAPYAVVGDSFRADKPQVWSPTSIFGSSPTYVDTRFDLHPDGMRIAGVAIPDEGSVVFVLNFFDYLRTLAPGKK